MMIPKSLPPLSTGVSLKRPARSPIATPTVIAMIIAYNVSSRVAVPLTLMISLTGCAGLIAVPKFPLPTFPRYCTYWT